MKLASALDGIRLSLHVIAAAIWVGGQLTLAGLVPTARQLGVDAPRTFARAFARVQWPAYVVLLGTGVWNLSADSGTNAYSWQVVVDVKIVVVLAAGLGAWLHSRSKTKAGLAAWGALAALASVAALVMGVFLVG